MMPFFLINEKHVEIVAEENGRLMTSSIILSLSCAVTLKQKIQKNNMQGTIFAFIKPITYLSV